MGLGLAGDWRQLALGLRGGDWPRQLSVVASDRGWPWSTPPPEAPPSRRAHGRPRRPDQDRDQALVGRVWADRGFTAILVTHDVAEAITLADRVILLEKGRVSRELAIDLPRPRRRDAPFARLGAEVLGWIMSLYAGYTSETPRPRGGLPAGRGPSPGR
jgi:sulfonate transport system ATP-binding protein